MGKRTKGVVAAVALVLASGVRTPYPGPKARRRWQVPRRAKVHGAAGTFDLPLATDPTNPTVEPRAGPAHTIVFTFDKPVTGGTAAIVEGVAVAGAPSFVGTEMRVPLTGAANAQLRDGERERRGGDRRRDRG